VLLANTNKAYPSTPREAIQRERKGRIFEGAQESAKKAGLFLILLSTNAENVNNSFLSKSQASFFLFWSILIKKGSVTHISLRLHSKKSLVIFLSLSRDVTNRTRPGREYGRVWLVTSRLGTGKLLTFFTVCGRYRRFSFFLEGCMGN
jgi:hypothetical protein